MLTRVLQKLIESRLDQQKVSLLIGARRVGKTELLRSIRDKIGSSVLWLNGEDADVQALLESRTVANYKRLLDGRILLIIDEAQYVPEIGRKAKLMIDEIKPLHIILTGSSAFEIVQSGEPLVGRTISYQLYSVAQMELSRAENALETRQHLEERLIYGGYPELLGLPSLAEKQFYLKELINTYLLKDILAFESIRQSQKLRDLLVLLAYQIGREVSQEELGRQLGIGKNTVSRYLDLLSKVFVIYSRGGFSRNLRKEVTKSQRWYFADNGVRNALINHFSPLALRQDAGQLWENYFMSERQKRNAYHEEQVNSYYWRTYDQQEIDLVEEKNGHLSAFECKWKEQKAKIPVAFAKAYPDAKFTVVNQENYEEWVT